MSYPMKMPFLPMCKTLVISNSSCTGIKIKKITKNEKYRESSLIALIDSDKICNINFIEIFNNKYLRQLEISGRFNNCEKIKIHSNRNLGKIIFDENSIAKCREFDLSNNCCFLEDAEIIFPKLNNCEAFSMDFHYVSAENLYKVVQSLKKCRKFNLNFYCFLEISKFPIKLPACKKITAKINEKTFKSKKLIKQLKAIFKIFPNLEKCNLSNCSFETKTMEQARLFAIIYQQIINAFPKIKFSEGAFEVPFENKIEYMKRCLMEMDCNSDKDDDNIYS